MDNTAAINGVTLGAIKNDKIIATKNNNNPGMKNSIYLVSILSKFYQLNRHA